MNLCGLNVGKVRLPMDNLTDEEVAELREVLVKMEDFITTGLILNQFQI
jgi:dihydrodipicolinate synthase/N-acetylneuraminate lyase